MKIGLFAALTLSAALLASSPSIEAKPRPPQDQLARITAGRTAGEPMDCIFLRDISSSEIVARTAIVYRLSNGTVVVNRPSSGANFLNRGDVLVTDTHSSQLCSIDTVRLVDSGTHMPSGSVGLGKFIPYPRLPRRN
ncbi:hypothetical protein WG901_08365 [Novosphingobium sp. PS1R-30]|uniref:Uncharacterized protein n=1 Tax=Novosphingobium anseongense TaxID=3133436 RepID=A0ABU8RU74_9SPHN